MPSTQSSPRRLGVVLAAVAVVLSTLVTVVAAPHPVAAAPDVVLGTSTPGEVLYGEDIPVTLTLSNPTAVDGFNASFSDVLPLGVSYVTGSSTPVPRQVDPGDGTTVLIWDNVADSLAGTVVTLDYRIRYDPAVYDVGDSIVNTANAYVSELVRFVPQFDPATGLAVPGTFTGSSEGVVASTELLAFRLTKNEPNAESELLRGVHDHQTAFTLTVDNNLVNPTDDFSIVDFLPAGLEFLGCGNVDNTTAGVEEFTDSGRIDVPGNAPALSNPCPLPSSVTTVLTDPDGPGNPLPTAVYTRVEWDTAVLGRDLLAGGSFSIDYVAAIPLFANTLADLNTPTNPLNTIANLDNNNGPSTIETLSEQSFVNLAVASGFYNGEGTASTDDDVEQVIAEDISIHKTSDISDFEQGTSPTFTLVVESSEYADSTGPITVTDTLPDSLNYVAGSASPAPSSIPADDDVDPYVLVWTLPAFTAPNSVATITFDTIVRENFRGGGPVSSSDDFTNTVELAAISNTITDAAGTIVPTPVEDESAAALSARGPTIDKDVALAVPGPISACGDGAGLSWDPDLAGTFRPGDIVCFRLGVNFPLQLDTLAPVVTDFLPAGFEYIETVLGSGNDIAPGDVNITPNAAANSVTFDLADINVGGLRLEGILAAQIVDPDAAQPGDILGNLMKFRYSNTNGDVFQLRDQADVVWSEPILTLDKSVATVNGGPPLGNPVAVNEGDTVVYSVAVENVGTEDALDVSVRDVLPSQIDCGDVSGISNGGSCSNADGWIQWDTTDDIDIAVGATQTLSYTVTVPDGVTPGITLVNEAGVRDYRGSTNADTPFTYVPADNIDDTLTPNTSPADDDAAIRTRLPVLTKTRTTGITQQPGNNAGNQATIGEVVTYTVTLNVPPGTSLTDGVITDVLDGGNPTTGEKNLVASSVAATVDGVAVTRGPAVAGDFRLQVDDAGNGWTLTPPNPYDVSEVGSGDQIVITFDAVVNDVASNTRNTTTGNTVRAAFTNAIGPQTISASVNTRIVEPNIETTKSNSAAPSGVVSAGQTLTYTVDVLNRDTVAGSGATIASVSTANDTVVVDTVPDELIVLEAPGDPAEDGDTIAPDGGTWNATSRTITWSIATIAPGATATRTYQVVTTDPLVAAGPIVNDVEARTTSIAGTPSTPAGEPAPTERSSTSPNGGPGSGYQDGDDSQVVAPELTATKTGDPGIATVGEAVEYTLTATIPAGVVASDVTVIDDLPVGITFETIDSVTCTEGLGTCTLTSPTVSTDGDTISFFFDDVTTGAPADRVITIVYTTVVADVPAADAGATLTNGAEVYWNSSDVITTPPGPTDPLEPGDFTGNPDPQPETFDVDAVEPTLTIDKDVSGQVGDTDQRRARPGDALTYTLVVTNTGSSPAYDVTVVDDLDVVGPGAAADWGFSYTDVAGISLDDGDLSDADLQWTIAGPIAPSASVTISYQLTAPVGYTEANEDPAGPELENTADIPSYWGVPESERTDPGLPDRDYREYDDVTPDTVAIELDLASIGDTVWFDVDGDGVIETGEPRLANIDVVVTYLGANGVPGGGDDESFPTTTDANGLYLVEDLPGGNYTVDVVETDPDFLAGLAPSYDLDGMTATPDGAWAGALDEDDDKRDVDFGYTGTGSIGDTIWFDRDADGVKDTAPGETEAGIEDVDVIVTWHGPDGDLSTTADNIEYRATTDADGRYLIDELPAGSFTVDVDESTLPAGYDIVTDPDTTVDGTSTLVLAPGADDLDQDFGYAGDGSIGDRVWLDQDGDGTQDAGEPGLEGVTVQLVGFGPDGAAGGDDDSTFTATTGPDGAYLFDNLPPGGYEVMVVGGLPATVTNTGDPQDNGDSTSVLTLADGEDNQVQDFGYDADSILGDFVWWDLNRDGVQDPGEPGIPGVEVTATGPNGLVLTTTTDAAGFYSFTDIPDGSWTVTLTDGVPTDFSATFDDDGGLDSTSTTTLVTSDLDQDFGLAGTSSIGDRVWLDRDRDGIQDPGEPGIENITVTLSWAGPDGVAGNGDDVQLTTETDANGNYLFPGLPAGDYVVTVDTDDPDFPVGVTPTFDLDGGTAGPDSTTPVAGLGVGEDIDTVDFGYAGGGTIGDTVWFDRNGDGAQMADEPGIGGAAVTLVWYGEDGVLDTAPGGDDETFTTTTDAGGNYLFTGLPEGTFDVSVDTGTLPGGLDATFDDDGGLDSTSQVVLPVNGSNLDQDFGYRGVNAIGDTVYLDVDNDGAQGPGEPGIPGQTVELVWTDAVGGPRTFTTTTDASGTYRFDGLPDGDFAVTVTGPVATIATNSGDPDGGGDSTSTVTGLGVGDVAPVADLDQDFGYRGDNTIGDRVWWDQNADGVDDAGEPGLAGVEVILVWFGPDGVVGTADDVTLPTATTDADGDYLFENLPDGNYSLTVGNGLPDGLDTNTFDADAGGGVADGRSIVTGLGIGDANPVADLDQDFGYAGTGTIGDTIWLDLDGDGTQDPGEPGIAEAQVTLTWYGPDGVDGTADDVVFPTQATGSDGEYLFEHVPAGTFRVDVANIDDDLSSTADPDGGDDSTSELILAAGASNLDQDFGYVGTASIGDTIWLDLNGDGDQDPGEPGLEGITVTVRSEGADGTIGTADDLLVVVDTDSDGRYIVEGLPADATTVTYDIADLGAGLVPDSDLDDGDLTTATVVLNDGDAIRDVDFGVVGDATVNGAVWIDLDNDGVRDPNEAGIAGVTVIVTWDGPNGPVEIPVVTDDDGNWELDEVPPGDYTAVVDESTLPAGLVRTTPSSAATTVPPGGSGSVQHGFVPAGSIGDRVWNDLDRDGVQGAAETGVSGVTVILRDGDGAVLSTAITDGNGNYRFGDLPPGTYTVEIDTSTVPSGVTIVADPDGTNDGRNTVTLNAGQRIDTVDFGVATSQGGLPVTGGQIAGWLLLAALLLALGMAAVAGSRRYDLHHPVQ